MRLLPHLFDTMWNTVTIGTEYVQIQPKIDPRLTELSRLSHSLLATIERRNELIVEVNAAGWSLRDLAVVTRLSYATVRRIIQKQKGTA